MAWSPEAWARIFSGVGRHRSAFLQKVLVQRSCPDDKFSQGNSVTVPASRPTLGGGSRGFFGPKWQIFSVRKLERALG